MKRLAPIALALILALSVGFARPEAARADGGDSGAVAVNLRDGTSIFRFAFHIQRTMSDVVDNTNSAVAFASCSECQTVALAVQVILIMSDPDVVSPTNLALALNYECTSCETLASAYQYVLTTGGAVHFTAEGSRRIAELRQALRDLLQSNLPIEELQARIDELMDEFASILATELVPAGESGSALDNGSAATGADTTGTDTTGTDTTGTDTTQTDTTETDTTGTDTTATTTTP